MGIVQFIIARWLLNKARRLSVISCPTIVSRGVTAKATPNKMFTAVNINKRCQTGWSQRTGWTDQGYAYSEHHLFLLIFCSSSSQYRVQLREQAVASYDSQSISSKIISCTFIQERDRWRLKEFWCEWRVFHGTKILREFAPSWWSDRWRVLLSVMGMMPERAEPHMRTNCSDGWTK